MIRRASALAICWASLIACGDAATGPSPSTEIGAGAWQTWVMASGAALRPAPPPADDSPQARAERDEIVALQSAWSPGASRDSMLARWGSLPTQPWHALALDRLEIYWVLLPDVRVATPVRSARAMALLNVAMYDALVATWDAKYTYRRRAPVEVDARIRALIAPYGIPSYPSEHAAVAAAAAAVLSYLLPAEDTLQFHALERQAGDTRIAAGLAHRSDVEAGYEIGRAVARLVIARAKADGSSVPWTGSVPTGAADWRPTPNKFVAVPFDANAGSWQTWVLPQGSALRLGAPPSTASAEFKRDLDELRALSDARTVSQANLARYWATDAPSAKWEYFMRDEIQRRRWPTMHAARALATASVAMYDAFIACWDSKYTYWLLRPISAEPALIPVFPTPPFPSYPSGHSTISTAAAEVFAELFPDMASAYRARGRDASVSRVYAAVHYRFDVDSGDALGERVGRAIVERMRRDGATR